MGHIKLSLVQRCPYFRVSFKRGSTVYTRKTELKHHDEPRHQIPQNPVFKFHETLAWKKKAMKKKRVHCCMLDKAVTYLLYMYQTCMVTSRLWAG